MTYDYRSYLNSIISLLQQILALLTTFHDDFSVFTGLVSDFFDQLMAFLPDVLFFILLFIGTDLVLRLFFPRWRDV